MSDEGVESRSDGVYRIHWKRIDSDGKVHFSIPERLTKTSLMMDEEVESRSDGCQSDPLDTNRFRWKISFSIPERLRMIPLMLDGFHSC